MLARFIDSGVSSSTQDEKALGGSLRETAQHANTLRGRDILPGNFSDSVKGRTVLAERRRLWEKRVRFGLVPFWKTVMVERLNEFNNNVCQYSERIRERDFFRFSLMDDIAE